MDNRLPAERYRSGALSQLGFSRSQTTGFADLASIIMEAAPNGALYGIGPIR